MSGSDDYRAINLASWQERAAVHAASPDYAVAQFADPDFLSDVVRFDLPLLGDVAGLRGVHLQCHIGTDTVSLARLGARMTGLDFSSAALEEGRRIAGLAGVEVDFVEGDLYAAPDLLGEAAFDLVFTGVGALCWLPDIRRWAEVVTRLLVPGGRLFIREGHPMLWALQDERTDLLEVAYPYFELADPTIFEAGGTYVETEPGTSFEHNVTHEWNHGIGEIITALLESGLTLTGFVEHRSVPWEALPGQMVRGELGEYRLAQGQERMPLTYTLQAVRSAPEPPGRIVR